MQFVRVCQPYGSVKANFAYERAALEELVRRNDPKATFDLGVELQMLGDPDGGSEKDRALGRKLELRAKELGYKETAPQGAPTFEKSAAISKLPPPGIL